MEIQDTQDDMFVLVVVDDEEDANIPPQKNNMKHKSLEDSLKVNSLIEMVKKHGESDVIIKSEPPEDGDWDYLEDIIMQRLIKSEPIYDCFDDIDNTEDQMEDQMDDLYVPELEEPEEHVLDDEIDMSPRPKKRHMLKPWERRSFVAELTKEYPELGEDEELLVNTLGQIMRSVKPPPPPRDYYIMNGIMFECIKCGHISETIPAASRHYQEKHGKRYLVCYACGVDFRSTTNLYKHEKRCIAPDARIVLKARAACLGRKGRSRPFLKNTSPIRSPSVKSKKNGRFPCKLCSAVFKTRNNLQSHENLHRGERPYRCHVCPSAYTSYSALSRHKKKHTDVQYICDYCKRSFKLKTALVSHMDTHRLIRKFGCNECSRRFAQKSALVLHINRVHRNLPPPCACQICPKRYPRMSLLKDHMKRAHGMTIMTRKMFFKSLPTMTDSELKDSKVIFKADNDTIDEERPYNTEEMFENSKPENIDPDITDDLIDEERPYNTEEMFENSKPENIDPDITDNDLIDEERPYNTEEMFENSKLENIDPDITDNDLIDEERPYNTEEMFDKCKPENIDPEITKSVKKLLTEYNMCNQDSSSINSSEEDSDNVMKSMQYVKIEAEGLGDNVIYIENGEIVQGFQCSTQNLLIKIEELIEGKQYSNL